MRHFLKKLVFCGLFAATAVQADENPVVVELYTSQGCSSCPPADALLQQLAGRSDVIALALHVDYWDYIGWKDELARPEFTARQHGYARAAGVKTVYTPQMVIAGTDHVIGSDPMAVMDQIQQHKAVANPVALTLQRNGGQVVINARAVGLTGHAMVVQMVRIMPETSVAIGRGENAGRTITYVNTVTSWHEIGQWDGRAPIQLVADAPGGDPVVVIVQQAGHGPILAAAELQ